MPDPDADGGLRAAVASRAAIDARALAALRIGLGATLLVDLSLRARSLTTFYTDAGVLPRETLAELFPVARRLSLHALSGTATVQTLLFALAAVAAVALAVGYRTRLATAISFVLLVSLHARNPLVVNAGDVLLRRLLFWSLLLPLGARWAVDADGSRPDRVASVAAAGLLLQVTLVYASNAAFKLDSAAWAGGDALALVLDLETFAVGLAPVLRALPGLLAALTYAWFGLVLVSPLLVLTTGRARTALAGAFATGHVGMALALDLGIFPLVSLVGLCPFLGPTIWDRVEARVASDTDPDADGSSTAGSATISKSRLDTLRRGAVAALVVVLLAWNAVAVGVVDAPAAVPDAVTERSWNMFGHPPAAESWLVARATTADGTVLAGPVAAAPGRPPPFGGRYPAARWRKFQSHVASAEGETLAGHVADDLCRRWSTDDRTVESVTLRRLIEPTDRSGSVSTRAEHVGRFDCGSG